MREDGHVLMAEIWSSTMTRWGILLVSARIRERVNAFDPIHSDS